LAKKSKENSDICAIGSKLKDDTERAIMATALKQGQEQVKIHRKAQSENQEPQMESDD